MLGEWRGGGLMDGVAFNDQYRFESGALGRFGRAEYAMFDLAGAQTWHDFGAYGIAPSSGRFFTHGFGSDGATAHSELRSIAPNRWLFEGRTDGSSVYSRYRLTLNFSDSGELEALTAIPRQRQWVTIFSSTYRREG